MKLRQAMKSALPGPINNAQHGIRTIIYRLMLWRRLLPDCSGFISADQKVLINSFCAASTCRTDETRHCMLLHLTSASQAWDLVECDIVFQPLVSRVQP
jgi:hypothetical protein